MDEPPMDSYTTLADNVWLAVNNNSGAMSEDVFNALKPLAERQGNEIAEALLELIANAALQGQNVSEIH